MTFPAIALPQYFVGQNLQPGGAQAPGNSGFFPLPCEEQLYWGATHVGIITWADIPANLPTATGLLLGLFTSAVNGHAWTLLASRLVTPFANAANAAQNSTGIVAGYYAAGGTAPGGSNNAFNNVTYNGGREMNLHGAYVEMVGELGGPALLVEPNDPAGGQTWAPAPATIVASLSQPAAGQSLSNLTQGEIRLYFRFNDNNLPG